MATPGKDPLFPNATAILEGLAEEQEQRAVTPFGITVTGVKRPDRRIGTQEHAARENGRIHRDIVAVLPDIAELERATDIPGQQLESELKRR